tara:strand:+ start:231 stop:836 length:606 start_codon:yes stop_codon:yes gene_type:complete
MNDLVQVIQVLTPEEVEFVNTELDKKQFTVSSIGFDDGETGEPRVDPNIRSSSGCYLLDEEEASKVIHKGMNNALLEYHQRLIKIHPTFDGYPVPGGFMTKSHRELIQVLEYVSNQKYNYHIDASPAPNSNEYHRKISIILYLTDDFEGGHTKFIDKKYKPPIGHALIFPSNWCFPHCGTMVTKGTKRVAVTWYYVEDTNV